MLAQLVVISGPDQGRTFSLEEGQTLVIGRGETASARLNDPFASRSHCRIEVDGGKFRLSDAGGSRFVETMLTVIETCRQQCRNAFAFVTAAVKAHLAGQPAPSLLAGVRTVTRNPMPLMHYQPPLPAHESHERTTGSPAHVPTGLVR